MRLLLVLALVVLPITVIPILYLGWLYERAGELPLWAYALMFLVPACGTIVAGALRGRLRWGLALAPLSSALAFAALYAYFIVAIAFCAPARTD